MLRKNQIFWLLRVIHLLDKGRAEFLPPDVWFEGAGGRGEEGDFFVVDDLWRDYIICSVQKEKRKAVCSYKENLLGVDIRLGDLLKVYRWIGEGELDYPLKFLGGLEHTWLDTWVSSPVRLNLLFFLKKPMLVGDCLFSSKAVFLMGEDKITTISALGDYPIHFERGNLLVVDAEELRGVIKNI